jgi:inhibitor of growth protein 3
MQTYEIHGMSHLQNWTPANGQALEGPGMPVSRVVAAAATAAGTATPMTTDNGVLDGTDMDADGDGDEKRYCFCNGVSYGEMIACDDTSCEREWVSF